MWKYYCFKQLYKVLERIFSGTIHSVTRTWISLVVFLNRMESQMANSTKSCTAKTERNNSSQNTCKRDKMSLKFHSAVWFDPIDRCNSMTETMWVAPFHRNIGTAKWDIRSQNYRLRILSMVVQCWGSTKPKYPNWSFKRRQRDFCSTSVSQFTGVDVYMDLHTETVFLHWHFSECLRRDRRLTLLRVKKFMCIFLIYLGWRRNPFSGQETKPEEVGARAH